VAQEQAAQVLEAPAELAGQLAHRRRRAAEQPRHRVGHRRLWPRHADGGSEAREQAALQLGGDLERRVALGAHQVAQLEAVCAGAGAGEVGERHREIRQLGDGQAEERSRPARLEPHRGHLGGTAGHDDRARHGADDLGGTAVSQVHEHVDAAVGEDPMRARGRDARSASVAEATYAGDSDAAGTAGASARLHPEPVDERPQAQLRDDLAIGHGRPMQYCPARRANALGARCGSAPGRTHAARDRECIAR
jgi:hypothetical protein